MIQTLFSLQGKKAIVTGASGSIGFACVEALASFGASVLLVGRDHNKLTDTKQTLQQQYTDVGNIATKAIDFDDRTALQQLFVDHADASILVNSVGINIPKPILQITEKDYDAVMDINVKSAFFQTQYFVAAKTISSRDTVSYPVSIIHISSQMGFIGGEERSVYCASKHAMQGMCKAAALELGQWNIRINTICPTFIETDLTRTTLQDPEKKKKITQSIVFKRLGQVQDLYGAVVYLASDASSLVTGTAITVDGGWTAR